MAETRQDRPESADIGQRLKNATEALALAMRTIAEHRVESAAMRAEISAERNRADLAGEEIANHQEEIAALHRRTDALARLVADRERELAEVFGSTSWRLTSGLRVVFHLSKRVALKLADPASWLAGGDSMRRGRAAATAIRCLGIGRTLGLALSSPGKLPSALRTAYRESSPLNRQYADWLRANQMTSAREKAIRDAIGRFERQPQISLLMPVYNIGLPWLEAAVDSVFAQIYPHWQLCIVNDASTAPHIAPFLDRLAAKDPRVSVKHLAVNEGISGASNEALALATGEFVAPLDHDDCLSPDALFEVVRRLVQDPTLDFIYTDHDVRDASGVRRHPFFKPDWSPDLLLSMNYITHFSVYRRTLVERVGGFRKGFEGSQDYDLLLRVTELTDRIAHVPAPLYSWCQAPTSVALNPGVKSYAHEAGRRALQDMMQRRGIPGEVVDGYGAPYRYRVKRAISGQPLVSIIVPTRNNWRLLQRCLRSLDERTTYRQFEIIVVDNDSDDPETLGYLESLPHRVMTHGGPFHFAAMNNRAAQAASGDHLVLLNDDTEVTDGEWLQAMLEHSQRPDVGAVGARLLFPNGTLQHAGVVIGIQGKAGHAFWGFPGDHPGYYDLARVIRNYSAVTAACLMLRRSVFLEAGGFDERFDVSYNDVDLCLRLRERGYLIVYTPYAVLYHHQSASRGVYDPERDRRYEELLRERWREVFERGDPYYNPHLTLTHFDFSMRN